MSRSSSKICPYCGASRVTSAACPECGGLQDQESREATAAELGPWFTRDAGRPFFPGCSLARMSRMIRTGHVTRDSIIRGPTTGGFWMRADRVPSMAHLFGVCHGCGERVHPQQKICAACQSPLFVQSVPLDHAPASVRPQPSGDAARDSTTSSASLVSKAQYRRIERLQNTVRLQIILLALTISLLCACVFLIFYFIDRQVVPLDPQGGLRENPILEVESDQRSRDQEAESTVRIPAPETPQGEAMPPTVVSDPPSSVGGSNDGDRSAYSAPDPGEQALEEVLEVMRDVTPAQEVLLKQLRIHLDRAEDPEVAIGRRIDAVRAARRLIDDFPDADTDGFFRARLTVLRGEFDKVERQILNESAGSPS